MVMLSDKALRSRSGILHAGLLAGMAAAIVELIPVLIIQGAHGVSAARVMQAIASGLLGVSAYSGGWAVVVLGIGLHVLVSLVAGVVFAAAAAVRSGLLRHPITASIGYGALVYLVMSLIVLPLSAAAFPRATAAGDIAMSLSIHIVAFALPIVLVVRRMLK